MAAFFAVAAWKQPSGLMRLGSGIIVAGLLWIVYYIRRHGTEAPEPHPDQTLAGYQRALISKYDHQTRLLRNAKFWYLLPLYLGLLTSSAGMLKAHAAEGALTWMDAIGPLVYTLVFAGVWWLNEVHAVRKLQKMRAQVLSATEETQC
jgi:hypothetical protein